MLLSCYNGIFYASPYSVGWHGSSTPRCTHRKKGGKLLSELAHVHGGTLFYRSSFIAFGLALGCCFGHGAGARGNFAASQKSINDFHSEIVEPGFLMRAKCQELLVARRRSFPQTPGASVRFIYDKAGAFNHSPRSNRPYQPRLALTAITREKNEIQFQEK